VLPTVGGGAVAADDFTVWVPSELNLLILVVWLNRSPDAVATRRIGGSVTNVSEVSLSCVGHGEAKKPNVTEIQRRLWLCYIESPPVKCASCDHKNIAK